MLKVLLLFIAVSYFSTAQTLPEGINRRIGNELDSTEADYFGLFSWVKGFKSGTISENNGELLFMISRQNAPDTVFTFSKKNAEYLNTYITRYEDIFTNPDIQKSIDWTEITTYLRPSNPIREVGEISIELLDKASLQRQLIWISDSLIVVWRDDSSVNLGELEKQIEIIPFYDVAYINNQAILGNHKAFVNNAAKLKDQSWFTKVSPELNSFLRTPGNNNSEIRPNVYSGNQLVTYSDVQEQYLKKFTLSLLYKFTMYNDAEQVFIEHAEMYSELVGTKRNWVGEFLYNINPMFSIGAEYSEIPYLDYQYYARAGIFTEPYFRDVISGNEAGLLCRIRPKPRDPITDNFESEIGLSIGRGNYEVSSEHYSANFANRVVTKASPWIFSVQFGYNYFITKFISVYGGMLLRSSTSFEITDANNLKKTRSVKFTQASSFVSLRLHPW